MIRKTLVLVIVAFPSLGLGNERVKAALEHRACANYASEVVQRLSFLAEKYLINENSTTHVARNLKVADEKNLNTLNSVKDVLVKYSAVSAQSRDEVLQFRKKIQGDFQALSASADEAISISEKFTRSTAEVEGLFEDLDEKVKAITGMNCGPETRNTLSRVQSETSGIKASLKKSRLTMERKIGGITLFRSYAEKAAMVKVLTSFADAAAQDFSQLGRDIENAFMSFSLNDDVEVWRAESMIVSGVARGFWNQYYLYNKSVSQLKSDIALGRAIESRINSSQLDELAKKELTGKVQAHIRVIDNALVDVVKDGWQGRSAMQKRLLAKVETKKTWKSESCDSRHQYLKKALGFEVSESAFNQYEQDFLHFMQDCIYRK